MSTSPPRSRASNAPFCTTRRALPALVLALVALFAPGRAQAVTLVATHDNTLFDDPTGQTSDGAGPVLFAGRNSQGNTRRGLVRFDLGPAVPPGSIVVYAQLRLTVSNAPNDTARVMTLQRVTADWGEGASWASDGTGAAAQSGDATWLYTFFPGARWSVPGGDFVAAASASLPVGGIGAYVWTGPGLVADVQAWVDDPAHNFGWLVRGEESRPATARRFESHESPTVAARPQLLVELASPVGVPGPASAPALAPAVPNPTRAGARLAFELPAAGPTRLVVDDASGRHVATLLDCRLTAGVHQAVWDGRTASGASAPPGVYFARLDLAGHRSRIQKIVVMR